MPKFCHNCGKELAIENSKFCPECGAPIAVQDKQVLIEPSRKEIKVIQPAEAEADDEVISDKPALTYKELGNKLEAFTSKVLQADGWTVQQNVRDHLESGARAEFDVIAIKKEKDKTVTRIVECKNYSKPVGTDKIQSFSKKVEAYKSYNNPSMLFVSLYFSGDARKEAEEYNVTLWDKNDLMNRLFGIEVGRYGEQRKELVFPYALPLLIDYKNAINIDLENSDLVNVNNAKLFWRPFYKITYSLHISKTDPSGEPHIVKDSGVCYVDAQDGSVLNMETPKENDLDFGLSDIKFKDTEEDLFLKELRHEPDHDYHFPISSEYHVIKIEPKVTKHFVKESAYTSIIYTNTKSFDYEVKNKKRKNSDDLSFGFPDTKTFKIIPKKTDVKINNTQIVYVPKWDVEFLSVEQQIYRREIIGYKGTVVSDAIRHCPKHKLLGKIDIIKKNTIAVCEVCGKALCKDHVFKCPICNRWFCEEHSVKCATCGTHYCPEHIGKCADCDLPICDVCIKKCPICGEMHCKKHLVKCEKCGTEVCSSCTTVKTSMFMIKKYTCKKCQ